MCQIALRRGSTVQLVSAHCIHEHGMREGVNPSILLESSVLLLVAGRLEKGIGNTHPSPRKVAGNGRTDMTRLHAAEQIASFQKLPHAPDTHFAGMFCQPRTNRGDL